MHGSSAWAAAHDGGGSGPGSSGGAGASGADELVRALPPDYVSSTTLSERAAHLEMYRELQSGEAGDVVLRWMPAPTPGGLQVGLSGASA